MPLGIALTLLVAAAIGAINGAIVSYMGISAFIATLAMGSILTGSVLGISGSQSIVSTNVPNEQSAAHSQDG